MPKKEVQELLGSTKIVTEYARMLPRDVFDYPGDAKKFLASELDILHSAGVYILYRDDVPYYVGKTDGPLFKRLRIHAKFPGGRYDNFWNFFSVFVIPELTDRTMVEGILIAAMPTANSAKPKAFDRHHFPPGVIKMMRNQREHHARLGRVHQERDNGNGTEE